MRGLCGKVYGTFLAAAEGGGERRMIAYFWGMALYSIHGWERDGKGGIAFSGFFQQLVCRL